MVLIQRHHHHHHHHQRSSTSRRSASSNKNRCFLQRSLWFAVAALIALHTVFFLRSQQEWFIEEQPTVLYAPERSFPKSASLSESIHASYFVQRNILPPLPRILNPDYGGLEFHSLLLVPDDEFQRNFREDDLYEYHYERKADIKAMDKKAKRDDKADPYDDVDFADRRCVPQKWAYDIVQNCNGIHEDVVFDRFHAGRDQFYDFEHLSYGHYRDTFLFSPVMPSITGPTDIVVKEFRYPRDFTRYNMQNINREALILEKLSGSDRITKIYGHCATTVLIERGWELSEQMVPKIPKTGMSRGRLKQETLDELQDAAHDVYPMNNFTAEEKLNIALAFTEGIAELHGYRQGVIAHDDVSIDQWMLSADGKVIFTDFNNAVPMEWDYKRRQYCEFWASYPGTFKAPEVYGGDHMVTEQVDIWPVGNLIFALLSGLKPYYDETDEDVIQGMALKGIEPYLDPRYRDRSYIERRMVKIMNQCHKRNPDERVDIFEVVRFLRETKERHERMKREADRKLLL